MSLTTEERAVLTARLSAAEAALHKLLLGQSAVSLSYDGESVTYSQADEAKLRRYIGELKSQLGETSRGAYRPGVRA